MKYIKTWQKEAFLTILFLMIPIVLNKTYIEVLSAIAVFFTFMELQINTRMREKQGQQAIPSVHCYKYALTYFWTKEVLWVLFFILTGAYSGIIGSLIFMLYPIYRQKRIR